jgi:hypothetical protein
LVRRALVPVLALAAAAPAAHAADPIMPLAEVNPGMRCSGLSVIRGTDISSFDVEILDVIAPEEGLSGPRILVRVSGPAVDASGVGPGFSGSPILCGGRNAGAISEGIGEYGNHVVLATPIEEILADRPAAAGRANAGARPRRDPALARAARPLAGPITVTGLSGHPRVLLDRAARRAGRPLLAAPAGPVGGYAPVELNPGAAVSAALSTGDLAIGGVGTVAYRDGDSVWAFGHPLDSAGPRSLYLLDSYVFGVISNPLALPDFGAGTYKLASTSGNVRGAITNDTVASVAGSVGTEPRSVPLRVVARDETGHVVVLESRLADERHLGLGVGLSLVAPLGAGQALERLLRSFAPVTFSMCARFKLRQLRRPVGFCNPYFAVDPALFDLGEAAAQVDFFDLAPMTVESAEVRLRARRGVTHDVLVSADGPRRARRGRRIRVRLTVQRRLGGRRTLTVPVAVPRSLRPGNRTLVLAGNGASGSFEEALVVELFGALTGEATATSAQSEPHSLRGLARAVRGLHRPLGIKARFKRRKSRLVLSSDEVSYEGNVRLRVRVLPGR